MTFDDILEQVLTLLKRQGRVSYRALKMRFEEIDDEYLDVLREELIDAQGVATDEDGRIMVWAGERDMPETTPEPGQTAQPVIEQHQPSEHKPLPTPFGSSPLPILTSDAERRQLTVMFCDLVGSTALSGQLDPEDLRDIIRSYQTACFEVIQGFEGHVAQLLGDGLLVYFGYPQAHEDDAQRAVRGGLGIIEAMGTLNSSLEREHNVRLAVRVGIHTGLVVVGNLGGEGHQEQLALGETPNVAARIQGLAEPDAIVISESTYRLVQGYFEVQALGAQTLRGIIEPMAFYTRVLPNVSSQTRSDPEY